MKIPAPLKIFVSTRNGLFDLATGICAIIGSFLLPPPRGASQFFGAGELYGFRQYITAVTVGLMLVLVLRWRGKRYMRGWFAAALMTFFFLLALVLLYYCLASRWSCNYNGTSIVIGPDSALTAHGKAFQHAHTEYNTPGEWVMAHAGTIDEIWTKKSIDTRCILLSAFYTFTIPVISVCMISVAQAIRCASIERSPHRIQKSRGSRRE